MTHTNNDTSLDTKLLNLTKAKDRWQKAVSLLEQKLNLFLDTDTLRTVHIPKNVTLALQRDLDSLNAGHHQVEILNHAIAILEKKRRNAPCNTPTNTTPATPTTPSS